ncbi:transposase [Streptomyces sp. LS1784]|uniref:transposase n=1 Tax=Streptomyces sp. LS1784 TaxID=2851533 RepID=UPI001CC90EC9
MQGAPELINEATAWGLEPKTAVADGGYGQIIAFHQGLAERGLDFVLAIRSDESAHPGKVVPGVPPCGWTPKSPVVPAGPNFRHLPPGLRRG